jgi:hypothetical protein
VKASRPRATLVALSLALAATVLLAQTAVAASAKKQPRSPTTAAEKGSKGAGHTKLPPGKGGKSPGQGGTPPGQAKKDLAPSQPNKPGGASSGKAGGRKSTGPKSSPGSVRRPGSSTAGTNRSNHSIHSPRAPGARPPTRAGSRAGQGGSLSGGSPLGGPGWFNFREGREFASDMAAREFRAPVDALIEASRDMAFPIVLALLVLLFLLLQGLMDRRDPKLAVAPLSGREILSFE